MTTQPSAQDETLQRFFDGDLPSEEAARVQRQLDEDPDLAERYARLTRLSRLMRAAGEEMADQVSYNELYARVQRGIEAEKQPRGLLATLKELLVHRPQVWVPAAGAVAMTAAVLLTVLGPGDEQPTATPQPPQAATETATAAPSSDSEIVAVDFGHRTGTVFEVSGVGGGSTPVVWINDTSDGK